MIKTSDKVLLGILVVLLIASASTFITATSISNKAVSSEGNTMNNDVIQLSAQESGISMEEAKAIALQAVPGEITEVEVENQFGVMLYEIEITNGAMETDVLIDKNGRIVDIQAEEDEEELTSEELEKINGIITEAQAKKIALDYNGGGVVTDFEAEIEGGRIVMEVAIGRGSTRVEIEIDGRTGQIIEVEYGEDDD